MRFVTIAEFRVCRAMTATKQKKKGQNMNTNITSEPKNANTLQAAAVPGFRPRERSVTARLFPLGVALVSLLAFGGCALTKSSIDVSYTPQANVAKVPGADAVTVQTKVVDSRLVKNRVSSKKNGYGMEMASITAKEDVTAIFQRAIGVELTNRGFRLGEGGMTVVSELAKFYNDFKVGVFAGGAIAEASMNVQVKKPDGTITFSKLVSNGGGKDGLAFASGSNAKATLELALQAVVSDLFADPAFVQALLASCEPRTASAK